MTRFTTILCIAAISLCSLAEAAPPDARLPQKHLVFLEDYCFSCHDSATKKGKVDLENLSLHITKIEQAELWQKVLNAINADEMPPEKKTQPTSKEKADFLEALANTMVVARRSLSDSGGKITMRRLNRREYGNTIDHLLGVRVSLDTLPADGGSGTFDTVGASLFISSDQIEQYLKIGRGAIDEWFEREAASGQKTRVFRVEPENTVNVASARSMKELEDVLDRFMHWKAGVDKAAAAPENREIMAKLLKDNPNIDPAAFPKKAGVDFYRHAQSLVGCPDPEKFGFRDDDKAVFSYSGGYQRRYAYLKHYAELPHSDRGTYLKLAWGIQRIDVLPDPKNVPPGTYKIRVRAGAVKGSDPSRHFIEIGHPQRVNQVPSGFDSLISGHQVTGTIEKPQIIETTIQIGANTPREFGIQERRPKNNNAVIKEYARHKQKNGYGTPPAVWVDWIELEGPLPNTGVTASKVHRVEPETTVNVKNLEIIKKLEKTYKEKWLPWKEGVDKAAKAPENQEVMAELRKKYPTLDTDPFPLYRNADRLKGAPDPRDYGGSDPINAVAALYSPYRRYHSYMKHYAELPHNERGAYLKLSRGVQRFDVRPDPKDMPPGNYKLRIRAGAVKGSDPSRHFIEVGHPQKLNGTSPGFTKLLSTQQISGTIENPQIIEVNVEIGANTPRDVGIQERQPKSGKLLRQEFDRHKQKNGYGTPPAIWVDWMELEGPIPDAELAKSTVTRIEPEKTINPENDELVATIEEGYARFTRWKKAVDKAAATPENQKRIAEIRKAGIGRKDRLIDHPNRFYTFTDRLVGMPDPKEFGLVGGVSKAAGWDPEADRKDLAYHKHYAALPHRDHGTYLKLAHGTGRIIVSHKKKHLPPGNYVMRVRVGAVKDAPAARRFIQVGHPQRQIDSRNWGLEGRAISTHQVTGTIENPQTIEIPLEVGARTPREFAVQEKQPNNGNLKALWDAHNKWKKENGYGHPPAIWIDWVELEGPRATTSAPSELAQIVNQHRDDGATSEADRARGILTGFATIAFRRAKPSDTYIAKLVALFQTRRKVGESFDVAIRTPLSVILASPGFLYLNEPAGDQAQRKLTDRELAVRLSYFLWSSPPDAQLLDLADNNALHKPEILRQQVDRMIADSRSDEFISGFMHQWLDMERLDFFQFDPRLHREFDESARAATRHEVYESFAHLLRDPKAGRIGKLLKSDYVIINGLLGAYYGIKGVTGDEFRKVTLPAGSPRGGLLGMAAIHAMGSDGIESSPVERGAWVLRKLLNDPPPPAPPNVPQLSRLADKPLTTREKLTAHQEQPQCASCHRKIDPIGFALENFDAAGKWRTEEHLFTKNRKGQTQRSRTATPIDTSGKLHNGPAFANYEELRSLIAQREPDFARGFTEALIAYALGRPFGFTDHTLAEQIVASAKGEQFAIREFLHAVIQSEAFQTK